MFQNLFSKIFTKCEHDWVQTDKHFYFDSFAPMPVFNKIYVFIYRCNKCGKIKKVKKW